MICMILDPRQKANFLEEYAKDDTLRKFEELYQKYEISSSASPQFQAESKKTSSLSLMDRFFKTKTQVIVNNDLKRYLDEPTVSRENNQDILKWWNVNEKNYPALAMMARDYLAIMPASVSSERTFSIGGLTINKDRCNLHTETARELMSVKSWHKLNLVKTE